MIAAMILPAAADEEVIDETICRALERGMVPCAPNRVRAKADFRVTFFNPACIPSSYTPISFSEKETPPCAA